MAGREFEARAKKVQKMSRDGLVEEDLRTGKKRRAVTGRVDAVRIGDRPMDSLSESREDMTDRPAERIRRPAGRGSEEPDASLDQVFRTGRDLFRDPGDIPTDRKRKKNMAKAWEPSLREAPSSLEGNAPGTTGEEGDGPFHVMGEESGSTDGMPGETHRTGLRQERAANSYSQSGIRAGTDRDPGRGDAPGGSSTEAPYRRKLRQKRYALNQREGSPRMEASSPETAAGATAQTAGVVTTEGASFAPHTDAGAEEPENTDGENTVKSSQRLQQIRGHPSHAAVGNAWQEARRAESLMHDERKNHDLSFEEGSPREPARLRETSAEVSGLDSLKEEIQGKQKKERLNQEQRKKRDASRLLFDSDNGMARGSGTGFSHRARPTVAGAVETAGKAAGAAAGAAGHIAHAKISEAAREDDNAGTQAANHAGMAAEDSVRALASRRVRTSSRKAQASRRKADAPGGRQLLFSEEEGAVKSAANAKTEAQRRASVKKFFRKQRQRRMIAAAKKERKTVAEVFKAQQDAVTTAAVVVRDAIVRNSRAFLVLGIIGLVFLLASTSIASCAALMQGAGSSVVSTTYPSTDEDIYAVENRYRELEAGLDSQISRMQQTHPTYDEFRFQIDEISHNPYHLISYFTAKYGQFTYEQVKDEVEEIFREQYTLTTSGERGVTITETRTVRPGDSLGDVTTSGYCSCEICCGPYAGGPTASGVYPVSNHTIAVDAYNPFVPMGTHVIMNGVEYVVEDTGAFDRFGVQFDVYYDDHQTALAHGHQVWEAYLAEGGGIEELELTTTRTVDRMSVVLTNNDLDTVLQNRMTEEEKVRYRFYNLTFGNRDYLFDLNNLPKYGRASSDYTVPPEALSDERFARMIAEAERHLGTPYVWGGYSPSGFDCSGFVCWVINHCGNGWDIGRTTAEGIRQKCYYVSPDDARPGDIIFFENTYSCVGASHVGIYVGDGMMIHCGEPVQYTSLSSYWQEHFMEFGRLP